MPSGPDICGPGTKKVHVIFNYKGKNHLINKDIRCKVRPCSGDLACHCDHKAFCNNTANLKMFFQTFQDDEYSHLYTLIVNPDNSYEVKIDNKKVESGSLEDDWDFLPPKRIKDPEAKKPEDWDDREKIPDPDDKKPEVCSYPFTTQSMGAIFVLCLHVATLGRTGTSRRLSQTLTLRNLMTGMRRWMESGRPRW